MNSIGNEPTLRNSYYDLHNGDKTEIYSVIKNKLEVLGLTYSDGHPVNDILNHPLPALEEDEKQALYKLLKKKINHDAPDDGVIFETTPEEIEKKIDDEIGLSSLILCGSRGIKTLGTAYIIRSLETAYDCIHGQKIDMKKALGRKIISFLDQMMSEKTDTDIRNYFNTKYPVIFQAHECVTAHLANLNKFSKDHSKLGQILKKNEKYTNTNYKKYPIDIIRRSVFDKVHYPKPTDSNQFGILSLHKFEIVNVFSMQRTKGILTTGSLLIDILPLLHRNFDADIIPKSDLGNGWPSIFHLVQGLIVASDEMAIKGGDILKAWCGCVKGKVFSKRNQESIMISEFLKETSAVKEIAAKLVKTHSNHLKSSKNDGAALLFHALEAFYKGRHLSTNELSKLINETYEIWSKSDIAFLYKLMCRNTSFHFSQVYGALCIKALESPIAASLIQLKLGGDWNAVVTLNIDKGILDFNLSNLNLLQSFFDTENENIPMEVDLAIKLSKRNHDIFYSFIKELALGAICKSRTVFKAIEWMQLIPYKKWNAEFIPFLISLVKHHKASFTKDLTPTIENYCQNINHNNLYPFYIALLEYTSCCHHYASPLFNTLSHLVKDGSAAKAHALLLTGQRTDVWKEIKNTSKFIDVVWHIAHYLASNQCVYQSLDLFENYILYSDVDLSFRIKGFFRVLSPLIHKRKKLPYNRIKEILEVFLNNYQYRSGYLASKCLSIASHLFSNNHKAKAIDLWSFCYDHGLFAGFEKDTSYLVLIGKLIKEFHSHHQKCRTLIKEFKAVLILPKKSPELIRLLTEIGDIQFKEISDSINFEMEIPSEDRCFLNEEQAFNIQMSLFNLRMSHRLIDQALALITKMKNISSLDARSMIASIEKHVLITYDSSLLFQKNVVSLYEYADQTPQNLSLKILNMRVASKQYDDIEEILPFIFRATNSSVMQEKEIISLLTDIASIFPPLNTVLKTLDSELAYISLLMQKHKKFDEGLQFFHNMAVHDYLRNINQNVLNFCLECIDTAEGDAMPFAEFLFQKIFSKSRAKTSKLVQNLLIKFSKYNYSTNVPKAAYWLEMFLKCSKVYTDESLQMVLIVTKKLTENQDEKLFSLLKLITSATKHNQTFHNKWCDVLVSSYDSKLHLGLRFGLNLMSALIAQNHKNLRPFYRKQLVEMSRCKIRIEDQDILQFIAILKYTKLKDPLVWTYITSQAVFHGNEKAKKLLWNCFIDVIRPNINELPFETGDPFLYLCYCSDFAKTDEIIVMVKLFTKFRPLISERIPSTLILKGYKILISAGYTRMNQNIPMPKRPSFALAFWNSYECIKDLVEEFSQFLISSQIQLLHFFGLYEIGSKDHFYKALDLLSKVITFDKGRSDQWHKFITDALKCVIISPFMTIQSKNSDHHHKINQIMTGLIAKSNKNRFSFETLMLLSQFYSSLHTSMNEKSINSLRERVSVFDLLLQKMPSKNALIPKELPEITESIVNDIKSDTHPELYQSYINLSLQTNLLHAFGQNINSLQTYIHKLIDTLNSLYMEKAIDLVKGLGVVKGKGKKAFLEILCHHDLATAKMEKSPDSILRAFRRYNQCLEIQCSFSKISQIHPMALDLLDTCFITNDNPDEFLAFFKKALNPRSSCHKFYIKHSIQLIKSLLNNPRLGVFMMKHLDLNLFLYVGNHFISYLNSIEKVTPEIAKVAEHLVQTLLSYHQSFFEAQSLSSKIMNVLLTKTNGLTQDPSLIKIDYVIHCQPHYLKDRSYEKDPDIISELIVSLFRHQTTCSLVLVLNLMGHQINRLKTNREAAYMQLCTKILEKLKLITNNYNHRDTNFLDKASSALICMLNISNSPNKSEIFYQILESCSDIMNVEGLKGFPQLFTDLYGRLITNYYQFAYPNPVPGFLCQLQNFVDSVLKFNLRTPITLDQTTLFGLASCLINGFTSPDEKRSLMEKFHLLLYCYSEDQQTLYGLSKNISELLPDSTEIQTLFNMKPISGNKESYDIIRSLVLSLCRAQTPQSLVHALVLMAQSKSYLETSKPTFSRFAFNQIIYEISNRFMHLNQKNSGEGLQFQLTLNSQMSLRKYDKLQFYHSLLSTMKDLAERSSASPDSKAINLTKLPPFFYKVYYSVLHSFGSKISHKKYPLLLEMWMDYFILVTDSSCLDHSLTEKNTTNQYSLMIITPFQIFKLFKNKEIPLNHKEIFLAAIQRLIDKAHDSKGYLMCAKTLMNTIPEYIIKHSSSDWKEKMNQIKKRFE